MDSKSSYVNNFLAELDKKFDAIFDAIDLPNIDLAASIDDVKKIDPRIDPVLSFAVRGDVAPLPGAIPEGFSENRRPPCRQRYLRR